MRSLSKITVAAVMVALPAGVHATELQFPDSGSGDQPVDSNYGDRVASPSTNSDYGGDGGPTPNVEVSYGPDDSAPYVYDDGYGDLNDVLYDDQNASEQQKDNPGRIDVSFTADEGFDVRLNGFDLGVFSDSDTTIDSVSVTDGDGNSLDARADVTIPGGDDHLNIDYADPLQGDSLTVSYDSTNLGGSGDNVAIDNVSFSQAAIPEPASLSLLGLGGVALLGRRRRR